MHSISQRVAIANPSNRMVGTLFPRVVGSTIAVQKILRRQVRIFCYGDARPTPILLAPAQGRTGGRRASRPDVRPKPNTELKC